MLPVLYVRHKLRWLWKTQGTSPALLRLRTDWKAGRVRVSVGGVDRGHAYFHRPLQAGLEVGVRQLSEGIDGVIDHRIPVVTRIVGCGLADYKSPTSY